MDEFLGGFFGSIVGMFVMGIVLTVIQNAQRAKQDRRIDEAAKEMARRITEAADRLQSPTSFGVSRGDA
jgi:CHASE1-domain containing sensor protein